MRTLSRAIILGRGFVLAACLSATVIPSGTSAQGANPPDPGSDNSAGERTATYDFSIPTQSLATALENFNVVTGVQLFYDSRLVSGRISPGVVGHFSASDALKRLLANTSLGLVEGSGVISLELELQDPRLLAAAPVAGPTLTLDMMHVAAPTFTVDHRYYAVQVAYAIQGALQRDSILRHINYHADINVWLSHSGAVLHLQFLSGSDDQNTAIADRLRSLVIGVAPPDDLEQPIRIKIHASGAS